MACVRGSPAATRASFELVKEAFMDIKGDKSHYIVMLRGALLPKGILFIVHEHGLLFGLFFFSASTVTAA
jgi:hypothetical protein